MGFIEIYEASKQVIFLFPPKWELKINFNGKVVFTYKKIKVKLPINLHNYLTSNHRIGYQQIFGIIFFVHSLI